MVSPDHFHWWMIGEKLESDVFCLHAFVSGDLCNRKTSNGNVNIDFSRETDSRFSSGAFSLPDYFLLSLVSQFIWIECSVEDDDALQAVFSSRFTHSSSATTLLDCGTRPPLL